MKKKLVLLLILVSATPALKAQTVAPELLDPVLVNDAKLQEFSVGQTLHHLTDSVLVNNRPFLTSLLEYNTPIYFKENGLGMVSSPSFRGTTASQTAVLWNGLNINSNFTGQTDFNTVNTGIYDAVDVRAGGGSLAYGSGAIGGTVHLNTHLTYNKEWSNQIRLGYGSFNTYDTRYRLKLSSHKVSFRLAFLYNTSDNDYKFKHREGKNTNGQYHTTAVNTALGVKLNAKNELNLFNEIYDANRHFPLYHLTEVPTKYTDFNTRNMLTWNSKFGQFKSSLKTAFLSEHYKYYGDYRKEEHDFGKANSLVAKYDLTYKPTQTILIDALLSHEYTSGTGSNVDRDKRNITSLGLLFKQQITPKLRYQFGMQKEITQAYGSPFLYSFGVDYEVAPFYTAKLSASKNFKRPTFNDLYWEGSGDPDLRSEKSNQIELGNQFTYKNWELTLTGYFNDIKDMIHWLPTSNGLFKPYNEDHIQTYGIETLLGWEKQWGTQKFQIDGTYAYTLSKNKESKKQLIYVPYHKATFSAAYQWKRLTVDYQLLYNGEVFLRTDNDPKHTLGGYGTSNLGVAYHFGKKKSYKAGARVNNLFDKVYENVKQYELPGIHYNLYITLNF